MTTENTHKVPNVPPLRFPEFSGEWERKRIRELFAINVGGDIDKKDVNPICTEHFKYPIIANALSNDGIYGYTSVYKDKAPCITVTGRGDIGKAKYRDTPLYPIVRLLVLHSLGDVDCLFGEYAINHIRIYEESTGVPQLTAPQLGAYHIKYPSSEEQMKIGAFLSLLDKRISTQNKIIQHLESLITGITQSVRDNATQKVLLRDVLTEKDEKNIGNHDVYSVSVSEGVINQIDYLGRSFAAKETRNYNVVQYGDIVYTKSPTGSFPYGIVKQSYIKEKAAVSPLYGVYKPVSFEVGYYLHHYFTSPIYTTNYLHKLIQKGAKNTINITNQRFLENYIPLPNPEVLEKYVALVSAVTTKLENEKQVLNKLKEQKNYLLSQMFI